MHVIAFFACEKRNWQWREEYGQSLSFYFIVYQDTGTATRKMKIGRCKLQIQYHNWLLQSSYMTFLMNLHDPSLVDGVMKAPPLESEESSGMLWNGKFDTSFHYDILSIHDLTDWESNILQTEPISPLQCPFYAAWLCWLHCCHIHFNVGNLLCSIAK